MTLRTTLLLALLFLAGPAAAQLPEVLVEGLLGIGEVGAVDDINGDGIVDGADVAALVLSAVPLTISSTVAESVTTDSAGQLFTFTFAEPVQSFDVTDVAVAGGTRCVFEVQSQSVYTLEVTGTGGRLRVSVPLGAAQAVNDGAPTAAAQYSNYYRDVRTITLPGEVSLELVRLPAGTFQMGSPVDEVSRFDAEKLHAVTLSGPIYMGRHEVTQGQWLALMGSWPGQAFNQAPAGAYGLGSSFPAYYLCWDDAQSFIAQLNAHILSSGQGPLEVRLPTEAEWEYAARAGTQTRFHFGNALGVDEACSAEPERIDNLWYCGNNNPTGAKAVGQKAANAFLLHDMHGNVFEWVADYYGDYPTTPQTDPAGPATGANRVVRGGSWQSNIRFCRAAGRLFSSPGAASRFRDQGFRIAANATERTPGPVPVTIASTIANGNVGRVATQTVTIIFSECVSGFTADDITVTGATKDEFLPVDGRTYHLVLTSAGGRVSIRVPENVALSTAGLGNLASSTYANFYQDTWTLNLPNSRTMELLRMPGGIFQMGSPLSETGREADETQHQVTISQDYYIARTEVTQAQWLTLQSLPGTQLVFLDDAPVQDANFNEVTAWIAALNGALAGTGTFDLPTEAQWEHACRAGTTTRFSFGNGVGIENNNTCPDVDDAFASMWYSCNRAGATGARRVAQKLANPWGLHDMHGNMFEYVRDRYGVYPSGAVTDPLNTAGASVLVRGGYYDGSAAFARSAERYEVSTGPTTRAFFFGFRIVGRKP